MERVPLAMRVSAVPGLGALMSRIPPTERAVRLLLRQIGLRGALASGRFTDDMIGWFLALLGETDTLRNDRQASPRIITPLRGENDQALLSHELLSRITAPVQLIWGADDPNGGETIARTFASHLPDARLEMIPAAGHAPWIDDPGRCAQLARSFLRS